MKKLLLHSCCAPCSSAVLERLADEFQITIYYYNPNIDTPLEFMRRREEIDKIQKLGISFDVITEKYKPAEHDKAIKGLERLGEGSQRCYECYKLRLQKTAIYAKDHGFDCFATTLSVSPHKNSQWLSEIGRAAAQEFNIEYLDHDFKKKDGYKRSLELSKELNLYRQNYCGCKYSKAGTNQ
jgi:Uncharacterized protein conserved in bacteria